MLANSNNFLISKDKKHFALATKGGRGESLLLNYLHKSNPDEHTEKKGLSPLSSTNWITGGPTTLRAHMHRNCFTPLGNRRMLSGGVHGPFSSRMNLM